MAQTHSAALLAFIATGISFARGDSPISKPLNFVKKKRLNLERLPASIALNASLTHEVSLLSLKNAQTRKDTE